MQDESNRSYYKRRAAEERERAKLSNDPSVSHVHLQMADEYEKRAKGQGTTVVQGAILAT